MQMFVQKEVKKKFNLKMQFLQFKIGLLNAEDK